MYIEFYLYWYTLVVSGTMLWNAQKNLVFYMYLILLYFSIVHSTINMNDESVHLV